MKRTRLCLSILAVLLLPFTVRAEDDGSTIELLDTTTTNIGQPLHYPGDAAPRITSLIVTLQPGEETGRHRHPVLTYGHILSGELEINYGEQGTKTYSAGDSLIEAIDTWHNGRNSGDELLSILVVFMGAEDTPNVERQ
ncbi:MAG: cupin domain-containing protein [Alphaproteobacteria bacterium]